MEFVVKHVRMMNTHIEGLTGIAQHNKGLEWVIKGVREKFECRRLTCIVIH